MRGLEKGAKLVGGGQVRKRRKEDENDGGKRVKETHL